jgi:superfamily II DNA or RNA helicase
MFDFSIGDLRKLATNNMTFARGRDYYKQKRIKQISYSPAEKTIRAVVAGSEIYRVFILLDQTGGISNYSCTCPAYFEYSGACKHIIAALLSFLSKYGDRIPTVITQNIREENAEELFPEPPKTDPRAAVSHSLVKSLVSQSRLISKEQIRLQVTLHLDPTRSLPPTIDLQIGTTRLYVVRKLRELVEAINYQRELSFGKSYTYQPENQRFYHGDQPFIAMLLEAYRDERNTWHFRSDFDKIPYELKPSQLKRFLEFSGAMENACWERSDDRRTLPIRVLHQLPPVRLMMGQGPKNLELAMKIPSPVYAVTPGKDIFVCDDHFYLPPAGNILPFVTILEAFSHYSDRRLPLEESAAAMFIAEVVPVVREICQLEIASEVQGRIRQEPLEISLWLDRSGKGVTARVLYQYGATEINPLSEPPVDSHQQLLVRDRAKENAFLQTLTDAGFTQVNQRFELDDEESIYRFLTVVLPELMRSAVIYHSESFGGLAVKAFPRFSGSVRFNETSDLLEISFDAGELTAAELVDFYAAIREKKRYFRLKNGTFITLDGPEARTVGKLLSQLGLSDSDLRKKFVSLPKYRALYLEQTLQDYGREHFTANSSFQRLVASVREPQSLDISPPIELDWILRDYQKVGFKWLKTLSVYGFGGILADDMGLGKTLQIITLVLADYPASQLPSLVIAPTSLVYNWREELAKFAPELPVLVLDGHKDERIRMIEQAQKYALLITSYPLIRRDIEEMKEIRFEYCFLDEAQHIKNPATINAKSVKQVKARRYFAVTGTPIENSLTELWSIFDFIMPGYLYSQHKFRARFETPIVHRNDPAALEDLARHIRPFILRRLKKEVLTELPDKIESKATCEMTPEQKKTYLAYLAKARAEFDAEVHTNGYEKSQIKILALLTRLRQICCHPALFIEDFRGGSGKLELLFELLEDSLSGGHRILIFSQFVTMLELIKKQLQAEHILYYEITGQTPSAERLERVHAFNRGEAEVFLISLKAGGTGLNLTGADTVIHYDPWWNPAAEEQATDRAHRIGQTNVVQIFKLVTHGTIEEKIYTLQQKKKELVDSVIQPGENFLGKLTVDEIRDLFEE